MSHNGWIVGGGAKYMLGLTNEQPKDWDILIPLENWNEACKVAPKNSPTNSWGGIKLISGLLQVDIWGDSLSHFIVTNDLFPAYAVSLKGFVHIVADKGADYTSKNEVDLNAL